MAQIDATYSVSAQSPFIEVSVGNATASITFAGAEGDESLILYPDTGTTSSKLGRGGDLRPQQHTSISQPSIEEK